MPSTLPARVFAPAKLTLGLRVTGVRGDGYHLIDAEMVTLDVGDDLDLTDGAGLSVRRPDGALVDTGPAASDLVVRALGLVGVSAHAAVCKRIPPGAGLGGGSADAAAVLRWAGWRGTPSELDAAARLGADVPFCLVGGRARVQGIGEVVEPLPHVDRTLTLVTPPFGCATPAVYARWDALGGPTGDHGNDLEPAALAVEPRLAEWRDRLGDLTGERPRLAGSGSTWFVEGAHEAAVAGLPGALVVRTTPAGYVPAP